MRWNSKISKLIISAFVLCLIYVSVYWNSDKKFELMNLNKQSTEKWNKTKSPIIICAVVCGENRVQEIFVLIKSALVFSMKKHHLQFVIISEKPFFQLLTEKLEIYQTYYEFSFSLREINFPVEQGEVWKNLFKPCASQRLFLPSLLPEIDKLIYVDSDTLFLSSPSEIYEQFNNFNSTQLAGLIQESENKNVGWYTRFARHEYPRPYGVNSGVMLMNLESMRKVNWEKHLMPIYDKYNLKIVFGDQDIINIYFYHHPDQLYILGCEYNYRPDHCMYTSLCETSKVQIIHGNRGYFHRGYKPDQPIFSQIYDAIEKYHLGKNPCRGIIQEIEYQSQGTNSNCNNLSEKFLKTPKKLLKYCENQIEAR